MHYREKVFRSELAWSGEDPETGARYVAAGTADQFAALEINGLRYLHLVVHADQAASVSLNRLEVREYLYPRTGGAYFRCDDPRLDALYQAESARSSSIRSTPEDFWIRIGVCTSTTFSTGSASQQPLRLRRPPRSFLAWHRRSGGVPLWMQ